MKRRFPGVFLLVFSVSVCVSGQTEESRECVQFADGLYTRGMYELAAAEYQSVLKEFPQHIKLDVIHFRLGECYLYQGNLIAAEKEFRRVFTSYPKSTYRLKAGFKRADVFVRAGRHEDAVELFQIVLRSKPERDLASACLYFSGGSLLKIGKTAEALKALEQVRDKYADSKFFSFALLELGELYAKGVGTRDNKKDENAALAMFVRAAEKPGSPRVGAEALFQVAEVYFRRKDFSKSAEAYRNLLGLYPKDERSSEARLQAAWASHNAGLYAEALGIADGMLKTPTQAMERPEWLYLKANCERQIMKNREAVATYAGLLKAYPESSFSGPARYERALTFYRMAEYTNAVLEVRQVDIKGEIRKDVYWLLAESYSALKQEAEAIQYYRLVVREFPDSDISGDATYRLAHHLQTREAYSEAARYYQAIAKKFPKSTLAPKALFASAFCLLKEKNVADAVRDWSELVKLYGSDPLAEESLYQKAMGETRLERRDDAMATLRDLMKRFPKTKFLADAKYWYGVHLNAAGKSVDAEAELRQALTCSPRRELEREIRYNLAIVLQQNGKLEESAGILNALLATPLKEKFTPSLLEWMAAYQVEKKRFDEAIGSARVLLKQQLDPAWQQRGWSLVGRGLWGKGDKKGAEEAFRMALKAKATTPYAAEAALRLGEISQERGKHAEAGAFFKKSSGFAKDESQRGIRARAYMGLARSAKTGEDFDGAARYFMSVAILYDDADLVPECLYEASAAFEKLGRSDESQKAIAELAQRYPESAWAKRAVSENKE